MVYLGFFTTPWKHDVFIVKIQLSIYLAETNLSRNNPLTMKSCIRPYEVPCACEELDCKKGTC